MRFFRSAKGAILVETLLVVPVVTIFAIGVVEFGSIFWQRQQLQAGVRDAARYWSRCTPDPLVSSCSLIKARNIAFYGTPAPNVTGCDSTSLRVRGWCQDNQITIAPNPPPTEFGAEDVVTVTGTATYTGSPIFGLLQIGNVQFSYTHEERYIGW